MIAVVLLLGSLFMFVWAFAAMRHQRTQHNESAPRCPRFAERIPLERRAAIDAAWDDVHLAEEIAGVDPTPRDPWPVYRLPPWAAERPTWINPEVERAALRARRLEQLHRGLVWDEWETSEKPDKSVPSRP